MQTWQDAIAALQAEVSNKPELLGRLQLLGDAAAARSRLDDELRQVVSAKDAEAVRLRGEISRMRQALQQSNKQSEQNTAQVKQLETQLHDAQQQNRQSSRAAVLQAAEASVNTPQGEVIALRAQLQAQVEATARLESELAAAAAASRARLSELQDSYTAKVADMRRTHAEALAAAEARLNVAHSSKTQIDAAQADLASARQQLQDAQEQAQLLQNKLAAAEASIAQLSSQVVQQQLAVKDAQQAQSAAVARAAAAEADASSVRAQLARPGGPTVAEMQGMLQLMEGQLARLSELVRARDSEVADLRRVLQAGFEERQQLTHQLEAAATAGSTGAAAAARGSSAAPANSGTHSPSSPTGSLHHAGRLNSSPSKPYRTGLVSKPRFK